MRYDERADSERVDTERADTERRCRRCGCTDVTPCVGIDLFGEPEACHWAAPDLCSACADPTVERVA